MAALKAGDVVVVTKLDRLGRSTRELLEADPFACADDQDCIHRSKLPCGGAHRLSIVLGRAMPYPIPASLSADHTYAVSGYILSLNGILAV